MERIRPRIKSNKTYRNHVSAALTETVVAEVDRHAAAAGLTRGRFIGDLILERLDDLEQLAARAEILPMTDDGPRRTVAATVGAAAGDEIRNAARRHDVPISRIVALIVADALTSTA